MTTRGKWLGLVALAVLWMGLVYVYVIDVAPPPEVPLKYQSGIAAGAAQTGAAEQWDVRSLHAPSRELPVAPKKNIFAAAPVPLSREAQEKLAAVKKPRKTLAAPAAAVPQPSPAPPPPPPSPEEIARQQEELAAQAARQQEELRRKQLQEQMAQYRYLGYLNQSGVQKAFLGKGREIYILRQGETLDGKFVVASIEAAAVKIQESTSKLETVLKLKKEESSASGT
jgi:hypothetical protein